MLFKVCFRNSGQQLQISKITLLHWFLKQSPKLSLWQILVATIFCLTPNALANPLKDYCISKTEPEEILREVRTSSWEEKRNKKVNINGENYIVYQPSGQWEIKLIRESDGRVINEISGLDFLEPDESISSLYITENKWLFIHADKNNYVTSLVSGDRARLGMPVLASRDKFYKKKCTRLRRFFDSCLAPYIDHSLVLDRIFISGYRETASGQHWSTIESIGDQEKTLPFPKPMTSYLGDSVALNGVFFKSDEDEVFFYDGNKIVELPRPIKSLVQDLPKFNGVLFKGTKDEILFYDGITVTEIPSPFPSQRNSSNWYSSRITIFDEKDRKYVNERVFLVSFPKKRQATNVVMELSKELLLLPINLHNKEKITFINLIKFPNDTILWATVDNRVYAEINNQFQTIVSVPEKYYINPLLKFPLEFRIGQKFKNKTTTYYITKVSPTAQCEIMLDINNPVELTVE